MVSAVFQTFVEQEETVTFPEQAFDAVLFPSAEQKQRRLMRIEMKMRFDKRGQPVNSFAHVGMAAGEVNVIGGKFVN